MKKVGIITIHKSTNYGACLQAHALWKFITLQGYNGFIIDLYLVKNTQYMKNHILIKHKNQDWK